MFNKAVSLWKEDGCQRVSGLNHSLSPRMCLVSAPTTGRVADRLITNTTRGKGTDHRDRDISTRSKGSVIDNIEKNFL